jgi:hypothetical protein
MYYVKVAKWSDCFRKMGPRFDFWPGNLGGLITELYGNKNNRGVLKVMRKLQYKKPKMGLKIYLVIYNNTFRLRMWDAMHMIRNPVKKHHDN